MQTARRAHHLCAARFSVIGIALLLVTIRCIPSPKSSEAAPRVPTDRLLAEWVSNVVDKAQLQGGRSSIQGPTWSERQGVSHAVSVVGDRLITVAEDDLSYHFYDMSAGRNAEIASIRTGAVKTSRYRVIASGGEVYIAFLDPEEQEITQVYRTHPGAAPEKIAAADIPRPHDGFRLLGLGHEYKPGPGASGWEGPLAVRDLAGRTVVECELPPGYGVVGYLPRIVEASGNAAMVGLPVFHMADFPDGLPDEIDTVDVLAIEARGGDTGNATAASVHIAADDAALRLMPLTKPSALQLLPVGFVGRSIDKGIILRRVAVYSTDEEELRTIELWKYQPEKPAKLIDMIGWYVGSGGSYSYRGQLDRTIGESPIAEKTSWNTLWQLMPDIDSEGRLVYAREDGIWKVSIP